jgi:hypothetical protein
VTGNESFQAIRPYPTGNWGRWSVEILHEDKGYEVKSTRLFGSMIAMQCDTDDEGHCARKVIDERNHVASCDSIPHTPNGDIGPTRDNLPVPSRLQDGSCVPTIRNLKRVAFSFREFQARLWNQSRNGRTGKSVNVQWFLKDLLSRRDWYQPPGYPARPGRSFLPPPADNLGWLDKVDVGRLDHCRFVAETSQV